MLSSGNQAVQCDNATPQLWKAVVKGIFVANKRGLLPSSRLLISSELSRRRKLLQTKIVFQSMSRFVLALQLLEVLICTVEDRGLGVALATVTDASHC